jgi:predicted ATPase
MLDLASGISPLMLNESELEVRIPRTRDSADDDFVNIADVGLAIPTILPVLVALIQAAPGQLVFIEQPELHLHPRAQLKLAQLLAEAANRGVRLVIETHSSLLLRGILTEIAKDKISNEKVNLHWFERDKETGVSTVHSKEPDPAGRVGDWPEDFGDVELGSDNDYLNAAEGKLFAAKK